MKKIFLGAVCALIGIGGAAMVHGSFMLVEADGSDMLPTIRPDQKVLIYMLEDDFQVGDVVAYQAPFYTINGGSGPLLKRVQSIDGDSLVLCSDADLTSDSMITIDRKEILGKAIIYG